TIKGWLYNRRSSGKVQFLLVRDGSGIVQCVLGKGDVSEELYSSLEHLSLESSIIVTGKVREDKRAPGGYELLLTTAEVVAEAQEYPITKKDHGVGFLMQYRHLWLRSRKQHALLRIRSRLVKAIYDFFFFRNFVLVDTPILTPSACEGTTTLFNVNYFDDKAYLTQSGQLYLEAAAAAFGKVFCFGPTFRAEKSKTRRHLTEFWMVEPEVAYLELPGLIELAEQFITFIVKEVVKDCVPELEILERNIEPLKKIEPPFPKITYSEAAEILAKSGCDFNFGTDFGAQDETVLSKMYDKPLMVTHYPSKVKAFYMKRDSKNPDFALCLDVLAPEGIGEIIGGSQREEDLSVLEKRIEEEQLPKEAFQWYLDVRRYGTFPHAGFGLGIERALAWISGTEHIRECIPFPRMLYKIYP
ncbi:MAG: asparagine--tRNA ligase, partial [Planctomycetota bacterium]